MTAQAASNDSLPMPISASAAASADPAGATAAPQVAGSLGKTAADNHPHALAERRAWAVETRTALDSLEADQRIVLVASYFEGQSHAEIAADLDLPEATVVATMTRAMRHLAALLAARGSITPLRGQRG